MTAGFDLTAIGEGLPFSEALGELRAAVTDRGVAVVQAPPGSGKTTLAPPLVAECVEGRVVVTGPRRVTVRSAAARLAHLTGTAVGDLVGYTVRGERHVRASTRIELVPRGVLVRRLLADPELTDTAAVVLDEIHERALDTDLLLGMLAEVRQLRDLPLVAMSATLDAPTTTAPPHSSTARARCTRSTSGGRRPPDLAPTPVGCPGTSSPTSPRRPRSTTTKGVTPSSSSPAPGRWTGSSSSSVTSCRALKSYRSTDD